MSVFEINWQQVWQDIPYGANITLDPHLSTKDRLHCSTEDKAPTISGHCSGYSFFFENRCHYSTDHMTEATAEEHLSRSNRRCSVKACNTVVLLITSL